jgi:hypothetical protein
MKGISINIGVHGNRSYSHFLASSYYSDGYFAAVGNYNLVEHASSAPSEGNFKATFVVVKILSTKYPSGKLSEMTLGNSESENLNP